MNNTKELKKEVALLRDNLNATVEAFERFQPFKKIETEEEAFALVTDPREYYDQVIVENSNMEVAGVLPMQANVVANAYKLDRKGYREAVKLPENTAKIPTCATFSLPEDKRFMFTWEGNRFAINRKLLREIVNL